MATSTFGNHVSSRGEGQTGNQKARKTTPMGLFKPDLYRAFFLGFGITALLMGAQFVPHLV
jgi:hypothetical protein